MKVMFFVISAFIPVCVVGTSPSCEVLTTKKVYYAGFPYKHTKKTFVDNVLTEKNIMQNYVSLQLIAYDNGKYGHYVSFSDSNEQHVVNNGTIESIVSTYMNCVSPSFKPKDISFMWVKGLNDTLPFEFGNETSKVYNGSVTLKCSKWCWSFNLLSGVYDYDCPSSFVIPSTLSIKFGLNVSILPNTYYSSSNCAYTYGTQNQTHDCSDSYKYGYSYTSLNSSLDYFRARVFTSPINSTIFRNVVKPHYLKEKYSQFDESTNYYSVCGQNCVVLPISA
jgi:hypothetical protein